jgi:hypothetical protein
MQLDLVPHLQELAGFAAMPTLTDLVNAMRPIEESYADS